MGIKKKNSHLGSVEAYAANCVCYCSCNDCLPCSDPQTISDYGQFMKDNLNRATHTAEVSGKPSMGR
jgi:putative bacteriocin precursor